MKSVNEINIERLKGRRRVVNFELNQFFDKKIYLLALISATAGVSLVGETVLAKDVVPYATLFATLGASLIPLALLPIYYSKKKNNADRIAKLKKEKQELTELIKEAKLKLKEEKRLLKSIKAVK